MSASEWVKQEDERRRKGIMPNGYFKNINQRRTMLPPMQPQQLIQPLHTSSQPSMLPPMQQEPLQPTPAPMPAPMQ